MRRKVTESNMEAEALKPIKITALGQTVINNQKIQYLVADSLEIAGYVSGRAHKMLGAEKKMAVNVIKPVAVVATIVNPLSGEVEEKIIISARFTKSEKKVQAILVYYQSMIDPAFRQNQRIILQDSAVDMTSEDAADNGQRTIESTSYDAKITAYVEAAGLCGFKFTGVKVFGVRLGGVYKQIRKADTVAIEKAAKHARRDFKRDTKGPGRIETIASGVAQKIKRSKDDKVEDNIFEEDIIFETENVIEKTAEAVADVASNAKPSKASAKKAELKEA